MPKKRDYDASSIQVLQGIEPVRKRPAMYIGSTGVQGLHHLVWEVVDNGLDEALAGYASEIMIKLEPDGSVTVIDNGRGIPVDIHPQTKKSALETVMTTLHAGGKFDRSVYKISGGLHGVGVSVVNALSEKVLAVVKRDKKLFFQEYSRGKAKTKVQPISEKDLKKWQINFPYTSGTLIRFRPDPKIFESLEFKREIIMDHLRQQAFLTKGIKITFTDARIIDKAKAKNLLFYNEPYVFYFQSGVRSYLKYLISSKKPLTSAISFSGRLNEVLVDIGLAYISDFNEHLYGFANNIYTEEGGMHLTGLRSALTRVISDYAKKTLENSNHKKEEAVTGSDVREGLVAIVAVRLPEPQFEGQTKAKLGNTEARTAVEAVVGEKLASYLEENPKEAKIILEKVFLAAKARLAAKAAKETVLRKGLLDGLTLPGKLADCASREPEESELFIVEGESAGGSVKQARDSYFQAVLPLRGKILNVEKSRFDRILKNEEIRTLIVALGMGVGEGKDIEKIRYHRIIIMTDADVDGSHIRTLLLTFFYRFLPEIIDKGFLYIAQPPLYKIESKKRTYYAYTELEKTQIVSKIKEKYALQRYKGLGEMDPQQLWETTMDPEKRVLFKVSIEDAEDADKIFSTLMGGEVEGRKKFIQTKAPQVKNLDI